METSTLADELELEADLEEAIESVTAALAMEGFGVLTRIDVHSVFKTKLDLDFRPYSILGACNPHMARRALDARSDVGLLLPCNVVVEQIGPSTVAVRIGRPKTLMDVADVPSTPGLNEVATQVAEKLERVAEALRTRATAGDGSAGSLHA